jgi:ribonuclease HII
MTSQIFAGVDEVGRGCLAGPVVSVAIILNNTIDKSLMKDSKKLTQKARTNLSGYILKHTRSIGLGVCDNHIIDTINIHNATLSSMKQAIINLDVAPQLAFIDGKFAPDIDINCECIIRGDELKAEISAASIMAKVIRDNEMIALDRKLPVYGFKNHKGYGTIEHKTAIANFGPSIYHRFSFAPLSK